MVPAEKSWLWHGVTNRLARMGAAGGAHRADCGAGGAIAGAAGDDDHRGHTRGARPDADLSRPDRGRMAVAAIKCCVPITKNARRRSEEHTSELQSLMRISYAVFCLKKKKK